MDYQGKILWLEGKPQIHRKDKLIAFMEKFPDDTWFEMTVRPVGDFNASNQRSLYFTWRDIIAEELGWTKEEMHAYLKQQFNGGKSTKGLDTKAWSQMMTQILAFAGENNITLPAGEAD